MRSSKSKLLLVLTIVLGLATTFLVANYLKSLKQTAISEVMATVVVPVKKIPQGTRITPDMVKTIQVPAKFAPPGALPSTENVAQQFCTADLWPEEVIVSGQLASEKTSSELPYKIPEGTRAITIAINPLTGVAGHIKPGHYVDILMNYNKSGKPEDLEVITLLQKVPVLAVGTDLQKKDGVQPAENITLAVNPKDAELVALAETVGKLKLVLRPAGDDKLLPIGPLDVKGFQGMY